ncbi:MAG: biopolymer transporter ExbD [Bacteroidales bacterium]|jgi:biopolymer transport protein ExbD|nr:biopolymer transporter ExbD [Bacteroidales bacterium]NLM93463.1 biopolymer transporter ExbD [Bacteroidales bacterium]
MARMSPEVNAGSMADIAFLLLIFFLVTTTMDVDSGIIRMLPPPIDPNAPAPPPIRERNVFVVLIDYQDRLLVEGQQGNINSLREQAKEFFLNPNNDPNLSEKEMTDIENLGEVEVSKGVISLQNDRGTSYEMYIAVQNELAAAVNELRNELSREKFGKSFDDLTDEDLVNAIREAVKMSISEAEPKDIGGRR